MICPKCKSKTYIRQESSGGEEFNLSKWAIIGQDNEWRYHGNYVKEFIRLLKEEIDNKNNKSSSISKYRVKHLIDWLAGEKLK